MADEFISEEDMVSSPRGRKVQINPELAATLKKIKPGQAALLRDTYGEVPKAQRATVSGIIRKHWRHVRDDEPSIKYTPQGVPQVCVRKAR